MIKNDAKRMLQGKGRFGSTFGEKVTTDQFFTENDVKRILHRIGRFDTNFRETINTNRVDHKMTKNAFCTKKVDLELYFEKQ